MKDIEGKYQDVVEVEHPSNDYHNWYLTIISLKKQNIRTSVDRMVQIVCSSTFHLQVGSAGASIPVVCLLSSSLDHKQYSSPVTLERPSRSVGCVEGVPAETFC